MQLLDDDRYCLKIYRKVPLRRDVDIDAGAFDHFHVELVRDDGHLCGMAEVYFPTPSDRRLDLSGVAAALGCDYLAAVCAEFITGEGFVVDEVNEALKDGLSQAFIVDDFHIDEAVDKPVLRAMFIRAILETLPRPQDVMFVNGDVEDESLWEAALGAKIIRGFVAASAARRLPVYPLPGPSSRRGGPTRPLKLATRPPHRGRSTSN